VEWSIVFLSKSLGKKVGLLKCNIILLSVCIGKGNSSISRDNINSTFPLVWCHKYVCKNTIFFPGRPCKQHYCRDICLHPFPWFINLYYIIKSSSILCANDQCGLSDSSVILIWNHVKWATLGLRQCLCICCYSCMIFIWLMILLWNLATPYLSFSFSPRKCWQKQREHEWAKTHCLYLFMFPTDSCSVIHCRNHHSFKKKKSSLFHSFFFANVLYIS